MTPEEEARITALLASLWERNLPILHERLGILDRAASEASSSKLSETTRAVALEIAHKLSGSLGMFGYHRGTDIAREIEQVLKINSPESLSGLAPLLVDLRKTVLS